MPSPDLRALLVAAAGLTLSVVAGGLFFHLREAAAAERPLLPLEFDHTIHRHTSCATCHHDFVDDTPGGGPCLSCHKKTEAIAARIEPMFHDLCQECHVEKALENEASGPVRLCSGCHVRRESDVTTLMEPGDAGWRSD